MKIIKEKNIDRINSDCNVTIILLQTLFNVKFVLSLFCFSFRYCDYKSLLASEVVQLLCIVPTFFRYLEKDVGALNVFQLLKQIGSISSVEFNFATSRTI